MRYYKVIIDDATSGKNLRTFTSLTSTGLNNPAALKIVMDIPEYSFNNPAGLAYIKLYGVDYTDLSQSSDYNGATVTVFGGMSRGLPLANPSQAGQITKGTVFQAFGNWQGTELTLDLIIKPLKGGISDPVNLTLDCAQGASLTDAVKTALTNAYKETIPNLSIQGSFGANIVANQDFKHAIYNINDFSTYVFSASKSINKAANYLGATIVQRGNGFFLFDGTESSVTNKPTQINATDMIGNGTWTAYQAVNFKTVMRADLALGNYILMPKNSNLRIGANTFTQFRNSVSFQNTFIIVQIRHVGDNKQPNADSWCTIIDAVEQGSENFLVPPSFG